MMVTDPIADMLTRIRNGIAVGKPRVDMPASKLKIEMARILKEEGYVMNYRVAEEDGKRTIKVYLKYRPDARPVITKLERISRPGCRVYVGSTEIPKVIGGMGVNILTTSRGVMTDRQARTLGVGGELLCRIY
ncbi:MAG: 30S ribosomal protein S8 [Acidobacteria bacterium]|nr:30S ribosomal protein S8 [Acidobacteriota bacterium]